MKLGISVIMPTYNQASFIPRALHSLLAQTFKNWELIIIDDGSNDDTEDIIKTYFQDKRICYHKNDVNLGLGTSLNLGIKKASFDLLAYLPSDDIYYKDHLNSLYSIISSNKCPFVYSGINYNYHDSSNSSGSQSTIGKIENYQFQLVQILHWKTNFKWVERSELVTSRLDIMFWNRLERMGPGVGSNLISAEWVSHPKQRHKIINEANGGGISSYKRHYNVTHPIRFLGSGNYIDELKLSRKIRSPKIVAKNRPLKILIVGELGFNPERILSFEQRGHILYGLWIKPSGFLCSIGPFPFGNVIEIKRMDEINEIKPDIIYALLNYSAVSLAHEVQLRYPDIPLVWHFKESPFFCRQRGTWSQLVDLYNRSSGQIYLNDTVKSWYLQFINPVKNNPFILDGDLPAKRWFKSIKSAKLSQGSQEIHTVVTGRPYGISPLNIKSLSEQNVHLHFYGNYHQSQRGHWINEVNNIAPGYLHLHNTCDPENWSIELSQYDAGWLHVFNCSNDGELLKMTWNELNIPARLPTLMAAGLPILFRYSANQLSATQLTLEENKIGLFFNDFEDIGAILRDEQLVARARNNVVKSRNKFTFDNHVDLLIEFFFKIINEDNADKT